MNRLSIMGALIVLLLAASVLTPAEAYHKRHHQRHNSVHSYNQAPNNFFGQQPEETLRATRGRHARSAAANQAPNNFLGQQSEEAVRQPRGRHARHAANRGVADCTFSNEGRRVCDGAVPQAAMAAVHNIPVVDAAGNRAYAMADTGQVIGGRPGGCPHAYCGCGLRKYLGLEDARLNLASNWARLFPRESGPRAGLAAVRRGHVMYIEAAAGNGQWLIRDYNSGGGLSRMHVRDVRGYTFVNPHGGAMASRS